MTAAAAWVLTIVLAAAPAEALSRLHFQRAQKHYAAHDYRRALDEFTLASENAPAELPELYFDIAQCHRNLGHARLAVLAFQHYLTLRPDAPDRAQVRAVIVQLGGRPPADEPSTSEGSTAPVALPPSASSTSAPRSFDVPGPPEEPKPAPSLAPSPEVATAAPVLVAAPPQSAPAPRKHRRWPIWVGVAGGVALTAVTVGLAVGLSSSSSPSNQGAIGAPTPPMLGTAGTFDTRGH